MRKGMWSLAAIVVLSVVLGPTARAAEEVTMGSDSEPNAFKFFPAEKSVPVGTTVTWRNLSDLQHDVKAVDNSFASPLLDKGQTFPHKFDAPGTFTYYCTVPGHRDAGMEARVTVTGGSTPTPTAAPTTTTTAPAPGATTTTMAPGASTTTTTRAGAGDGGSSTTTTTAGLGATSTTQAAATTPTSAPETGDVTTTTEGHGGEEEAAADHGSEGGSDKKTNPVAVGLAGILTAALAAISLKLLTGKP